MTKGDTNIVKKVGSISEASASNIPSGALGLDEDEGRAKSEAVQYLFNFPTNKIFSWTRWRKREIPLVASILTKLSATDPNRPKDEFGMPKSLSQIYLENLAWLRLAEEGAQRNEGMGVFQTQAEEKGSSDAWRDMQ